MGVLTVPTKTQENNRWQLCGLALIVLALSYLGRLIPVSWGSVSVQTTIFHAELWRLVLATFTSINANVFNTDMAYFLLVVLALLLVNPDAKKTTLFTVISPVIALCTWLVVNLLLSHHIIGLCGLSTLIWNWLGLLVITLWEKPHRLRNCVCVGCVGLLLATMFYPAQGYPAILQFESDCIHLISFFVGMLVAILLFYLEKKQ